MSFKNRISIIPIVTSILVFSCAVKESPSGGEEDRILPAIITVEPEPGSLNIPADTKFSVLFSKQMSKERTENAVFLSPVFWDYPELKWSGKKLTITPPEPLKENVTYVLTIGAGATGFNNNQMGVSRSYAFSTGNVIDSGSISGAIYVGKGRPTTFDIWAYSVKDTINPVFLTEIPDYATQVDSIGNFEIKNISAGNYVVIAVDDKNDDLFWDPTSESIGLPPAIISLYGNNSFDKLVIRPDRRDTIPASISRAKPLDNRKITVEFSQPVYEELKLDIGYYFMTASDSSALEIEGAFIGAEGKLVLETALQNPDISYKLTARGLISSWGVAFDSSGGRFTGSAQSDSSGPELIATIPAGSANPTYQNDFIELIFSERIKALGFEKSVEIVADSLDTLKFIPEWNMPHKVKLVVSTKIPREKPIRITLIPSEIYDIAGNPMPDSELSFSFRIPPADTVGFVKARTVRKGNMIGELYSRQSRGGQYVEKSDGEGNFNYNIVFPGIFYFRYYDDSDSNGIWSSGLITPFQPAEWFGFLTDSVTVRSRWTTDLDQID